ncbi:unnamed protein product [Sphagnum jensenii]|uniref:DEAD/DEAH box helicase n=1 Tax=Sphagnum jensenii TaxID=128206 RepID=A0ABP0V940_9BRYO
MTHKAKAALQKHGNTLCVAPTGAGKTIMLSMVVRDVLKDQEKSLIIQHTDEIFDQNMLKFSLVDGRRTLSKVNGKVKDFSGDVIFSMVQSLQREQTLAQMPKIDLLVIDEAHHSVAPTYEKVIEAAKARNPALKILGMTATPTRADKHGLAKVFSNVADQITIEELVASGDLLYPRTFVIETTIQDKIRKALENQKNQHTGQEDEFEEAENALTEIDITEIIRHWRDKAEGRKTVIFCHRIEHSKRVAQTFHRAGIKAFHVDGTFEREERQRILSDFTEGDTQMISNISVLTEGWDYPPTSCIILLRALTSHPVMVQMIGRGLRTLDQKIYPDMEKTNCIVLDFGLSVAHYGSIESKVDLLPKKRCPACKAWIPYVSPVCPVCGIDLARKEQQASAEAALKEQKKIQRLKDIEMREIELQKKKQEQAEKRRQAEKEKQLKKRRKLREQCAKAKQIEQRKRAEEERKKLRAERLEEYKQMLANEIFGQQAMDSWFQEDREKQQKNLLEEEEKKRSIIFSGVDKGIWMASGDQGYAAILHLSDITYALVMGYFYKSQTLIGTKTECLQAGGAFLLQNGGGFIPTKGDKWGQLPPTPAQLRVLRKLQHPPQTRRQAAAMISYKFHKNDILKVRENHQDKS